MDDFDPTAGPGGDNGQSRNITLFLGLFLLVLAFFILLVSISTLEEVKTKAVQDSLSSTFTSLLPPSSDLTAFTGQTGEVIAGQRFQDLIAGLFASAVQVAKVEILQPGRQMQVTVAADALFQTDSADIRPAQYPLMDRIVASLSQRPAGLRFEMEFVVSSPYAGGKSLPIGQTLEMARAGAFAREMSARGAPPGSVVVGMQHGEDRDIVMWFYVRDIDEQAAATVGASLEEGGATPAGAGAPAGDAR